MSTKSQNGVNKYQYLLFICVGVVILLINIAWSIKTAQFLNNASVARGVVIKLNAGGSHPEIQFTTKDNDTITYPQNGLISGYQVNDQVEIIYSVNNPREACVNSFGALWGFICFGFVLGLVFIIVGLVQKFKR